METNKVCVLKVKRMNLFKILALKEQTEIHYITIMLKTNEVMTLGYVMRETNK